MRIPATNRSVEVSYVSGKRFVAVSCIRCTFDGPMPAQGYVMLPDKVAIARKRGTLYHKSAMHIQFHFHGVRLFRFHLFAFLQIGEINSAAK